MASNNQKFYSFNNELHKEVAIDGSFVTLFLLSICQKLFCMPRIERLYIFNLIINCTKKLIKGFCGEGAKLAIQEASNPHMVRARATHCYDLSFKQVNLKPQPQTEERDIRLASNLQFVLHKHVISPRIRWLRTPLTMLMLPVYLFRSNMLENQ